MHFVNPNMWMLTFNVILGYQGLLFCDFLLFFLSFFFFQSDRLTQYQETHLTLNERMKRGWPYCIWREYFLVSWPWLCIGQIEASTCPPPGHLTFLKIIVQIPPYPGQNAVQMPHTRVHLGDQMPPPPGTFHGHKNDGRNALSCRTKSL